MVFCDHLVVLPVFQAANDLYKETKSDKGDEWQLSSGACKPS